MYVNLIPPELRLRMLARRQLRRWGIIWGVCVVLALVALSFQYRLVYVSQTGLESLDARTQPLRKVQRETQRLFNRHQALEAELTLLESIEPPDHSLELMMILSSAAKSIGEPLQIQQMRLLNERKLVGADPQNQTTDTKPPAQTSTLTLQGIAVSDRALARFVDALRQSPPLEQIELKSSSQWQSGEINGRQFQVECRFAE